MAAYSCIRYETPLPMDTNLMGLHIELGIKNFTGEELTVMVPNGRTYTVDPIAQVRDPNPRVQAEMIVRDHYNHAYAITNGKNDLLVSTINFQELNNGPVVLTEFNLIISLSRHAPLLMNYNVFNEEYYNRKLLEEIHKYWYQPGYNSPICIVANCHNTSIEYLYMVVNDTILKYRLIHDCTQAENLHFNVNAYNGWRKLEFQNLDWEKLNFSTVEVGNSTWVISTNFDLISKYLDDKRTKDNSKLLKSDVDAFVNTATQTYQQEIAVLKDQLANASKEIEILKKALGNTKTELDGVNEGYKRSFEQQMWEQKGNNLKEEAELLREKRMFARESDMYAERQRFRKAESDLELARAKVEKEKLSLASTEASNFGTYAKTAAVVIPTLVGVGAWVARTATAALVPCGIGLIASAAISTIQLIPSIISKTKDIVVGGVKKVWGWIKGLFS